MIEDYVSAAKAYLDVAQPQAEAWKAGDAQTWIRKSIDREALGLRAALRAVGVRVPGRGDDDIEVSGQSGEAD